MARTNVPLSAFTPGAALADPAGTAIDATNSHNILVGNQPQRIVLRLTNTSGASKNVTVKAGVNPPAQNAGKGDLVVAVANGATVFVGPLAGDLYTQNDGSLNVDIAASHTGTITAFQWPTQFA